MGIDYTDTQPYSKSFEWMSYPNCNFLEILSASWLYYLLITAQILLLIFAHFSGCREVVLNEMIPECMGWFIRLTDIKLVVGLAIILFIETFYEVFLNSIMGLNLLINVPAITFNFFDWFSVAANVFFCIGIINFLLTTAWFANTTYKHELETSTVDSSIMSPARSYRMDRVIVKVEPDVAEKINKMKKCWQKVKLFCQLWALKLRLLVKPDSTHKVFTKKLKTSFLRSIEGERKNASYYFPIFIARRILLSVLALYLGPYPWL